MLKLSKKTLYAIEAVVDVAYHMGPQPVQSRDITRRQGIPRRYLEQALQQLVRAGILIGMRGPKGGYRLARERRRISVGEIVRAVAGDEADDLTDNSDGSDLAVRVVRPLWARLRDEAMARLDDTIIDDLCSAANKAGVESEGQPNLDFII
ncbi:MAG: Rrf2 family transcriptional regulator [Rhodospirillaceae bacterium]